VKEYRKLQVGSSDHRRSSARYKTAEWTNLDIVYAPGVNVLGSGLCLPFPTGTFEEVHCIHVLEHLTRDKYPKMISEMYRVLKPGGYLYVEVPDFKGTVENLTAAFDTGDIEGIRIWTTSIYGKSEREGMAHHWGFYEGSLRREFRRHGFKDVDRLTAVEDMISGHYRQEPVLLVRGTK
jgi:ubiquinone/menaquinone biosynthesis C-methylase UbiE